MARKFKRAAGLIDCRIHLDCHRTHSSESDRHPRRISLSAIGRCLKDQYDAQAAEVVRDAQDTINFCSKNAPVRFM